MSESLLSRIRACEDGRGLQLWRKLYAEWRGSAPQVVAAKAWKSQDPQRCLSMQQLWDALPSWEQLGSEVLNGGYVELGWVKAQTHDKLFSQQQLSRACRLWAETVVGQCTDGTRTWRNTGPAGLRSHHAQMEPGWRCPHAANAQEPSLLWHLQGECAKLAAGDWDGVSVLSGAIVALAKGKSKGKGKGTAKGNFSATGCNVKKLPQTPSSSSTFFNSIEIRQR